MTTGTLYIVSTPIGNLEDITFRAVDILKEVNCIAAEDTRHASILLKRYSIHKRCVSYYKDNEERRSTELIHKLQNGEDVALICNAGTPAISDPGFKIIKKAAENSISVVPVPGPSSILSALVVSGLKTDRFCFEGFLPKKKGRRKRLLELKEESRTLIIFESPYRLVRTLRDMLDHFGDRNCVVAREMTKVYEEFKRGTVSELLEYYSGKTPKGECVIVIEGSSR